MKPTTSDLLGSAAFLVLLAALVVLI